MSLNVLSAEYILLWMLVLTGALWVMSIISHWTTRQDVKPGDSGGWFSRFFLGSWLEVWDSESRWKIWSFLIFFKSSPIEWNQALKSNTWNLLKPRQLLARSPLKNSFACPRRHAIGPHGPVTGATCALAPHIRHTWVTWLTRHVSEHTLWQ